MSTPESPLHYLEWWRTTVFRDREIVDGIVHEGHRGPSAGLARALAAWPGPHYWAEHDGAGRIVLIRRLVAPPRERWWLHALLFGITFVTVWMGGALLSGGEAGLGIPFSAEAGLASQVVERWWTQLGPRGAGLEFAFALMAILLAHETGHYLVARRYAINASPPYFLPAPPWLVFIGTIGAFIRLRSPIVDRRQLLDIGAAGPWAGFVVALIALVAGFERSELVMQDGPTRQLVMLAGGPLYLGDSPIVYAMRRLLVGEGTVLLHPLALAGWLGMFITALNLIPLGQLDGGHVAYSLIGRWQGRLGPLVWVGIVVLGAYAARQGIHEGAIWWLWALLLLIMGRGRLAHPEVLDRHRPLPKRRWPYAVATLLLLVATFAPVPIHYL